MFFTGNALGNKLFLYESFWQGFFEYDFESSNLKLIHTIDKPGDTVLFNRCISGDEWIAFLPNMHSKLAVYGKRDKGVSYIDLKPYEIKNYYGFFYHDKLVILSKNVFEKNSPILLIDVSTGQIKQIDIPGDSKSIVQRIAVKEKWVSLYDVVENVVHKINIDTQEHYQFQTEVKDGFALYETHDGIWITGRESASIYKVNEDYEIIKRYDMGNSHGKSGYGEIISMPNGTYAIPNYADYILKYDAINDMFLNLGNYPDDFRFKDDSKSKLPLFCMLDDVVLFFQYNSNKILLLDTSNDKMKTLDIQLPQELLSELIEKKSGREILFESDSISLGNYVMAFK